MRPLSLHRIARVREKRTPRRPLCKNRCASCVRAASRHGPPRVAKEHASQDSRRCPVCRRICCHQLRFYGTDFAIASDNRRCALANEQPRGNADAHTVAIPQAVAESDAISDAISKPVDGKRHRSGAGHNLAQPGALQRPGDYRYCELRDQTKYVVLRPGAERNRRCCGDGDTSRRHIRRGSRLTHKSEFADCGERLDDDPHAVVQRLLVGPHRAVYV